MVVKAYDYDTRGAAKSWAKIIALRHALSKYPDCKYLWFLDQDSYIMDYSKTLENQVTGSKKLESLMIKDHPIVPPDSIIKTFAHLKGDDAEFIVSQDNSGLVANSVVIRNGDWAKFFIETWMDPLYRSYNFQKAERHALVCIHKSSTNISNRNRNTLFSGTPPSSRSSPSSHKKPWPLTLEVTLEAPIKTETL